MLVDLRSDTVTRPTAAMRRAMAEADVGDDGCGEDRTVRSLEEAVAERVGTEAAVFVSSGTMANQIAPRLPGLGAPVGSVLAGDADAMAAARIERKRLGGAVRQAGIVAAAGLVALRDHVDRLADDHARARRLGDVVGVESPTNCVVFEHPDPVKLLAHLGDHGVPAGTIAPRTVRLMTHLDVDDEAIEVAIAALESAPGR